MALTSTEGAASAAPVIDLGEPGATDVRITGAKAANLAKAAGRGLPVLPGFVVTAASALRLDEHMEAELRRAWDELSGGGRRALVVRSSSAVEDGTTGSMAGVFKSILDVRGWDEFLEALALVVASAASASAAASGLADAPMAVLVQPQLDAVSGGVMFGADPVSGRADRILVAAVEGGPEPLVSGRVDGARHVLAPRTGRILDRQGDRSPRLRRPERRALVELARLTAHAFGGPQDVEWAFDRDGRLWLLQARPITAMVAPLRGEGPVLGPGPVAETFPEPLSRLEDDLWIPPLQAALREALVLTGAASRRAIAASPVVRTVDGWAAADLDLLGVRRGRRRFVARLDPRRPARRLGAAWRVGRLRAAFPTLADALMAEVDANLAAVPSLATLDDATVLGVVVRGQRALTALHGHEVLAGMLASGSAATLSGAGEALQALAIARAAGVPDDEIVATAPAVLALVPPAIGRPLRLPETTAPSPRSITATVDPLVSSREQLRLRVRLVHELTARAAAELGRRLADRGVLADRSWVRHLTLAELGDSMAGAALPPDLGARIEDRPGAPLPAELRLSHDGEVVAVAATGEGHGVSGGRTVGRVHQGDGLLADGDILVVRALEPALAAVLPRAGGIVSETGSALSHLAILARELGIPAVVGVPSAVERFPAGSAVLIDGGTGEVVRLDTEEPTS